VTAQKVAAANVDLCRDPEVDIGTALHSDYVNTENLLVGIHMLHIPVVDLVVIALLTLVHNFSLEQDLSKVICLSRNL
jgi:hypothetical protein